MQPLDRLTYLAQVRRLRRLAENALAQYGLDPRAPQMRVKLLQHAENTTFRVDVAASELAPHLPSDDGDLYQPGRYLLRVHRDGYHNADALRAEMAWMAALRQDEHLPVPETVRTPEGQMLVIGTAPDSGETRHCTLLRWMRGRNLVDSADSGHMIQVGKLMARLHQHARTWQPPEGFTRGAWDWEGLFGAGSGWHAEPADVWAMLPKQIRYDGRVVAGRTRQAMEELGTGPDAYGLLHADLHLGNLLFHRTPGDMQSHARAIDFDDCGYGHHIYDLATALAYDVDGPSYRSYYYGLLSGYDSVKEFPMDQLRYLNLFIAARYVSLLLWATDMATQKPNIAEELPRWQAGMHNEVRAYLEGTDWASEWALEVI